MSIMSVEARASFSNEQMYVKQQYKENDSRLSPGEQWEMSLFLLDNPYVTADDAAILFTAKFSKHVSSRVICAVEDQFYVDALPPSSLGQTCDMVELDDI